MAADNVDIAEEALHLIEVDIDPLPTLIDPKLAAESSTEIHQGWQGYTALPDLGRQGNITSSGRVQWGDVDQGMAQADHVYEDRFEVPMAHQMYIEPRASMAIPRPPRLANNIFRTPQHLVVTFDRISFSPSRLKRGVFDI